MLLVGLLQLSHILDRTGIQVSIIKESFYRQNFNDQDLQPLKKNMSVKCANGGYLSYLGYVIAEVDLLGASTNRTLLVLLEHLQFMETFHS
jgi:hypothetical protein